MLGNEQLVQIIARTLQVQMISVQITVNIAGASLTRVLGNQQHCFKLLRLF